MAPAPGRSAPPDRTGQPSKPGTALVLRNEPSAKRSPAGPKNELADFAKDLRELRTKAGLGYPEMAELSHYTMKTLAAAAGGLTLPTLPVTAAYVRACDGNVAEWEDRWHRIADAVKPGGEGAGPQPGAAPDGTPGRGNGSGGRATGEADKVRGADGTGQVSGTGQADWPAGTEPGRAGRHRDRTTSTSHPARPRSPHRARRTRDRPLPVWLRPRRTKEPSRCTSSRRQPPGGPTGDLHRTRRRPPRWAAGGGAGPGHTVMLRP